VCGNQPLKATPQAMAKAVSQFMIMSTKLINAMKIAMILMLFSFLCCEDSKSVHDLAIMVNRTKKNRPRRAYPAILGDKA